MNNTTRGSISEPNAEDLHAQSPVLLDTITALKELKELRIRYKSQELFESIVIRN